ncbi:hypothetical protein TrRE_jg10900 [Triparma retinervis]|uniref:Uncharacterized protein n=1 Tax=Triparma retinervis TaxID=2557542 RepID=A0A9W7DTM6_9STRA|nr:hypothetical protein TrRE_jg10900 [Triparma retinervis]
MAPLFYFNETPYRAGISTKHHEAHHFTHTGTWEPELTKEEQLEERRRKLKKQMSQKRKDDAKANPSRHRTASMSMEVEDGVEPLYSPKTGMNDMRKKSVLEKRDVARKHTHSHKMLAEMMLRGDSTRHWGRNTGGGENAHQLPYDLAKTAQSPDGDGSVKKRSKLRYVPNPHEGIPQPDFSAGRFTSTVSIRPAHSKRSTVRMGFSGHAPGPSEKVERCRALDDLATKRLVDTPVIVSEGVLKEARGINILRTAGEFPHRDRVPLDEKIRSELDWLKDGAFIKAEHYGRPRTKGLISSEIHKMTREPIMSFVPLKNRKEYRENIMSMGMTPVRTFGAEVGRDKKKVMNALLEMNKKKGGGKPVSPANRGKLMQVFTPLKRGSLETITSEDGSQTGSQSVSLGRASSLQELSVEAEVDTNRDGVGGKGDGSSGGGGGRGNQRGDELQQRILQQRQMFLQQQLSEMGGGGAYKVTGEVRLEKQVVRPSTTVGLMGRRINRLEVRTGDEMYQKAERPITITGTLKTSLLRQRGVTSGGGF